VKLVVLCFEVALKRMGVLGVSVRKMKALTEDGDGIPVGKGR